MAADLIVSAQNGQSRVTLDRDGSDGFIFTCIELIVSKSRDFGFGRRIEYRDDDPTYWTKKEAQPESRWPSPFSVSDGGTYTSSNRGQKTIPMIKRPIK